MFMLSFFNWWYRAGWLQVPTVARDNISYIAQLFSVRTVLATLFAPWKQDVVASRSKAVQDRINALIGNLVSRFIGFSIRLILLFIVAISIFGVGIYRLVQFIVWPILPFAPVLLILAGVLL